MSKPDPKAPTPIQTAEYVLLRQSKIFGTEYPAGTVLRMSVERRARLSTDGVQLRSEYMAEQERQRLQAEERAAEAQRQAQADLEEKRRAGAKARAEMPAYWEMAEAARERLYAPVLLRRRQRAGLAPWPERDANPQPEVVSMPERVEHYGHSPIPARPLPQVGVIDTRPPAQASGLDPHLQQPPMVMGDGAAAIVEALGDGYAEAIRRARERYQAQVGQ